MCQHRAIEQSVDASFHDLSCCRRRHSALARTSSRWCGHSVGRDENSSPKVRMSALIAGLESEPRPEDARESMLASDELLRQEVQEAGEEERGSDQLAGLFDELRVVLERVAAPG